MDVPREIVLREGTNLITITYSNDIQTPTRVIYHLTFAEALVVMMDMSERLGIPMGTRYLQTFQLTETVVIKPHQKTIESVDLGSLDDDSDQLTMERYMQTTCEKLGGDGFAENMVIRGNIAYMPAGRIVGYVICRPNILIHVQSFKFDTDTIKMLMSLIVSEFMNDEHVQERGYMPNLAVVLNELTLRIKDDRDAYFTSMFVQPAVEGYATANIIPVLEQASMTRLPASPPLAALSPKNPASPIENFDAFATVANDVLRIIAMNMRLEDLLATCQTSQRFNREICNDERFWAAKVMAEFPGREKPGQYSWKQYYQDLVGRVENAIASIFHLLDQNERAELLAMPPFERIQLINRYREAVGVVPLPVPQLPLPAGGVFNLAVVAPPRAGDEAPVQIMFGNNLVRPPVENPLANLNFDFDGDPVERLEQRPALWRREGFRQMDGLDAMRLMQQEPARRANFMPAPVFPPAPNDRGNQEALRAAAAEGQLREFARAYENEPNPLGPEDFQILTRLEENPETIRILRRLEDYRDQFGGIASRIGILHVVFGRRNIDDPPVERQLLAIWRFWERLVEEGVIGNQMPPLEDDILDENQLAWNEYVMNPDNIIVTGGELRATVDGNEEIMANVFRRLMDYGEMFELEFGDIMDGVYRRIALDTPNHFIVNEPGRDAREFILHHYERITLVIPMFEELIRPANRQLPLGGRLFVDINSQELATALENNEASFIILNTLLQVMGNMVNLARYGFNVTGFMTELYADLDIREPNAINILTPDMRVDLINILTRRYLENEAIRRCGVLDVERRRYVQDGWPDIYMLMKIINGENDMDVILDRIVNRIRQDRRIDQGIQRIFDNVDDDPLARQYLTPAMRLEIRNRILNRINPPAARRRLFQ